jgi:hypothetical protein
MKELLASANIDAEVTLSSAGDIVVISEEPLHKDLIIELQARAGSRSVKFASLGGRFAGEFGSP